MTSMFVTVHLLIPKLLIFLAVKLMLQLRDLIEGEKVVTPVIFVTVSQRFSLLAY